MEAASRRLRLRKPSPSMAVAIDALVVALGGTSYAAFGPFNGNKIIKKHSLSGNRLKKNSVTGTQVNLSKLGKVPSASKADAATTATTATSAGNANTVGGKQIKQFFFKGAPSTATTVVLPVDGILVKAGCNGAGQPVITGENDSGVGGLVTGSESGVLFGTKNFGSSPIDFTHGATTAAAIANVSLTNGTVVTITYSWDYAPTFNNENVCTVSGYAVAS